MRTRVFAVLAFGVLVCQHRQAAADSDPPLRVVAPSDHVGPVRSEDVEDRGAGAGAPASPSFAASETAVPDDHRGPPKLMICKVGSDVVTLTYDGEGEWRASDGTSIGFAVPHSGGYIEAFRCGVVERSMLILWQVEYGGEGADSAASRVDREGRVRWTTGIPGFNLGDPLVVGGVLYVSVIGSVGAIDLESGRYRWKQDGLYRSPGMYNGFARPHIEGERIIFPALHAWAQPDWPKALEVSSRTGAILAGAPPPDGRAPHANE